MQLLFRIVDRLSRDAARAASLWHAARLARCGRDAMIRAPRTILGGRFIHIGTAFDAFPGLRIEAFDRQTPSVKDLTLSERRILRLIAEARSNKEIAEMLFISVRTVEHHRSNICAKLGLTGKNALLTFALTHKSEL